MNIKNIHEQKRKALNYMEFALRPSLSDLPLRTNFFSRTKFMKSIFRLTPSLLHLIYFH